MTKKFDEIYGILGAAVIRDENPAPHDMVSIAVGFLAGDESDISMVEEAVNYLMTGDYDPAAFVEQVKNAPKIFNASIDRAELFTGLRAAMNV